MTTPTPEERINHIRSAGIATQDDLQWLLNIAAAAQKLHTADFQGAINRFLDLNCTDSELEQLIDALEQPPK